MDDRTLITALNGLNRFAGVSPSDGGAYDLDELLEILDATEVIAFELQRRGYKIEVRPFVDTRGSFRRLWVQER